jgi:Sigma-70 region 2
MARPRGQAVSHDEVDHLVERARDEDGRALERLLVSVQDDVHRLALRMTGSPDDALHATQEILIRVMTRCRPSRAKRRSPRGSIGSRSTTCSTASAARWSASSSGSARSPTTYTRGSRRSRRTPARSSTSWLAMSSRAARWPCSPVSTVPSGSPTSWARSLACPRPTGRGFVRRPSATVCSAVLCDLPNLALRGRVQADVGSLRLLRCLRAAAGASLAALPEDRECCQQQGQTAEDDADNAELGGVVDVILCGGVLAST